MTMHWRGHPGLLIPHRQWCRENLPASKDGNGNGITNAGDDGFLRFYERANPVGRVMPLEWKTHGASMDWPTHYTFKALEAGHVLPPAVIALLGGNTPGPIENWPAPCAGCGLPEPAIVAEQILLNGETLDGPEELRSRLLSLIGWEEV